MDVRIFACNAKGSVLLAIFAAAGVALWAHVRTATAVRAESSPVPVLVELFTSEGCSSCPPADALLARLDARQPVTGAQVIVLSEHVTYWNSLGWRDPFSSDAMTERQQRYADRFGLSEVYTPQAVVDGAAELVGSDERSLERAVAKAATAPKFALQISDAQWSGDAVHFSVRSDSGTNAVLMAALAEDAVQSSVLRGENGGRTLRHVAVVRSLQEMGKGAVDGRELAINAIKPPSAREPGPLRLVVFLTDRRNGRVLALAQQTIRP
jgi:hypothetical protein